MFPFSVSLFWDHFWWQSLSLSLSASRFNRSCSTTECCNNSLEQTALIEFQPHSYQRDVSRPGVSLHIVSPLSRYNLQQKGAWVWLLKPGAWTQETPPGLGVRVSLGRVFPSNMAAPCGWAGSPLTNHRPVSARLTNQRPGLVTPLVRPGLGLTVPDTDDVPYQDIFHE